MTKDKKIRVLITGATGFLGSNILSAVMARLRWSRLWLVASLKN